ncbi:MAG: hypothetical protein KKC01_03590 [Gammaproteobacteria bacterium]|nr:hypothetical protein [Gammaproteobacteria bacterium]
MDAIERITIECTCEGKNMLKSILAMLMLATATAALAIDPPVLPPKLTAGAPIQIGYRTGPCDQIVPNPQSINHQTTVSGNTIEVTLSYLGLPWDILICPVPIFETTPIALGSFEQGDYILRTFITPENTVFPVDPSDERILLFETNFSVGPAATAVPTMHAPGIYLLALLLAGFGLLWLRRGQATRLLES